MDSRTDHQGKPPPPQTIEYSFSKTEEVAPGVFSFTLTVTAPQGAAHYLAGIRMVLQQDFGVPID